MKLIYTNENAFLVNNIKNLLQQASIEVMLKNEFASGGAGDLSPFDTWPELWLINDSDFENANQIIDSSISKPGSKDWICEQCGESNDASFDFCWSCNTSRPAL